MSKEHRPQLSTWGRTILHHCPYYSDPHGVSEYALAFRAGATGSSYNDYIRMIRELVDLGYIISQENGQKLRRAPN